MHQLRKCMITGTHGSGKSTLSHRICSELKKAGYNAIVISETARESPFPINQGQTLYTTLYIALKQAVKELEAIAHGYTYLVLDRGVLDSFMYSDATRPGDIGVLEQSLRNAFIQWTNNYDDIIFVKSAKTGQLHDDGVRDTNVDFAKKIENLFENLLFTHFQNKVRILEHEEMLHAKIKVGDNGEICFNH